MKKMCKRLMGLCIMMLTVMAIIPFHTHAADSAECTELTGNSDWKWPVPASNTLSSCYLDGREHYAIDIWAPQGSEVYACYEGEVIEVYNSCTHNYGKNGSCGCNGDLGNSVSIHHTYNGVDYVSRYGHLSSVEVSVGDIVTTDMIIGTVGSTGYSGNYHLDLRIYQGSTVSYKSSRDCVDPLKDLFLEIPEGLNASKASTGCCYSYVREVNEVYEEFQLKKAAEEKARQEALEAQERAEQQALEAAIRNWVEHELIEGNSYLDMKLVEVSLGFENFLNNYK